MIVKLNKVRLNKMYYRFNVTLFYSLHRLYVTSLKLGTYLQILIIVVLTFLAFQLSHRKSLRFWVNISFLCWRLYELLTNINLK